jgi:hypothetical protein
MGSPGIGQFDMQSRHGTGGADRDPRRRAGRGPVPGVAERGERGSDTSWASAQKPAVITPGPGRQRREPLMCSFASE